eukprot:225622-Alexandrium_andersonii.AAC.1
MPSGRIAVDGAGCIRSCRGGWPSRWLAVAVVGRRGGWPSRWLDAGDLGFGSVQGVWGFQSIGDARGVRG